MSYLFRATLANAERGLVGAASSASAFSATQTASSAAATRRTVRVGDRVVAMNISISRSAGSRPGGPSGRGGGTASAASTSGDGDEVDEGLMRLSLSEPEPVMQPGRVTSLEEFPALREVVRRTAMGGHGTAALGRAAHFR